MKVRVWVGEEEGEEGKGEGKGKCGGRRGRRVSARGREEKEREAGGRLQNVPSPTKSL